MDWYDVREGCKMALCMIAVVISVILGVALLIVLPLVHISAIGEVEKYNQLDKMVQDLDIDKRAEDILGKVADWNMRLGVAKKFNKIPIIEWWTSDKIAKLDYIKIPK